MKDNDLPYICGIRQEAPRAEVFLDAAFAATFTTHNPLRVLLDCSPL